jgi:peptide/nickel transport system ATP-binding protein
VSEQGAPLLEVDELSVDFTVDGGVVHAVDGMSLTLAPGERVAVVGESGSGKTVTALAIMGLIEPPGRITAGDVRLDGRSLTALSERDYRQIRGRDVAMVFQDPMTALNPAHRVGAQVAEAITVHDSSVTRSAASTRAVELLESVGIASASTRARDYPHQFSGGMRQRVLLAMALANRPRVLIADEPTTALDVTTQAQILELLDTIRSDIGLAVVLVTHDLGVVAGRADEVIVMYAGQVVERAPTATLFADMKMPYTEALLRSIPKVAQPSHTRLVAIPGRPPDLVSPPAGCRFAPRCAYVQDRCRVEQPPLRPATAPGHEFRCWFPVGTPEGQAALEHNRAAGVVAAAIDPGAPTPRSVAH